MGFYLSSHTFTVMSFLLYIHFLSILHPLWLLIYFVDFGSFLTDVLWPFNPLDISPLGSLGYSLLKTSHRLFPVIVFFPQRLGFFLFLFVCSLSSLWCFLGVFPNMSSFFFLFSSPGHIFPVLASFFGGVYLLSFYQPSGSFSSWLFPCETFFFLLPILFHEEPCLHFFLNFCSFSNLFLSFCFSFRTFPFSLPSPLPSYEVRSWHFIELFLPILVFAFRKCFLGWWGGGVTPVPLEKIYCEVGGFMPIM